MRLGTDIRRFDEVTSTNEVVKKMARGGASEGLTVVAAQQTAGRGRRGHTWWSPPGGNLYLSVLLRPNVETARVPTLAPIAGVAVARALEDLGVPRCGLKWPNDVRIDGRKVAGILAESLFTDAGLAVVLGIGVNVRAPDFPPELAAIATSLHQHVPHVDLDAVLNRILGELNRVYVVFLDRGLDAFVEEWNQRHDLAGQTVRIDTGGKVVEGEARGIRDDGALEVETRTGIVAVAAGEVE